MGCKDITLSGVEAFLPLTSDNSQHFHNNTSKYFVNHSETIKFAVQFLRIYGKIGKECSERARR